MKDYVVLKKPQEQADRLLPPRTLILDFTPDGALRTVSRMDKDFTLLSSVY